MERREDEYGIYSDVTDGQSSHSALIRYAVGPHAPPQRAPLALTPSRMGAASPLGDLFLRFAWLSMTQPVSHLPIFTISASVTGGERRIETSL